MKIDISTIVKSINKVTTEEVEFSFDTFESKDGTFTILEKSPISLKIANQENAVILISGEVDLTVAIPCGRCLEDVTTDVPPTTNSGEQKTAAQLLIERIQNISNKNKFEISQEEKEENAFNEAGEEDLEMYYNDFRNRNLRRRL